MRSRRTRSVARGGRWVTLVVALALVGATGAARAVTPSLPGVRIEVTETVTASDSLGPAASLSVLVDDDPDVGENVGVADLVEVVAVSPPVIDIPEPIGVADLVDVQVVSPLVIEVGESVNVADLVEIQVVSPPVITIAESVHVADLVDVQVTPLEEPGCSLETLTPETLAQLDRLENGEITFDEFLGLIDPVDLACVTENAPECVAAGDCEADEAVEPPAGDCSLEDLSATTLVALQRMENGEITFDEFLASADPADMACILANTPECVVAGTCDPGGPEEPDDPVDEKACEADGTCPESGGTQPAPLGEKQCETDGTCPDQGDGASPPPLGKKQCEIDGTCPPPTAPPSSPNKGTKP